MNRCPLCKNENIEPIEEIDTKLLKKLYRKSFDIDISSLVDNVDKIIYSECGRCKLRYYHPLIAGDEHFYSKLQEQEWYYLSEKYEYGVAKAYICESDKVLEVGSGKGAFAKHLPTKRYVGLDFSKKAKAMAEKNGVLIENSTIQEYVADHRDEFDIVVSFQVLEHVFDPASFVDSMVDALKVGGKLIVAVPAEDSFLKYVNNGLLNMPPHHVTRWSDETLTYLGKMYGLDMVEIHHEKVQPIHKAWYFSTLIQSLFMKQRVLSDSLFRRLMIKVSNRVAHALAKGIKDEMLPNGHTVVAVYEKR